MQEQRSVGVMEQILRRFAKKWQLEEGAGHKAGFLALMAVLKYCYEIRVKYVTVYAFSIDNFSRIPDQVQYLMELMHERSKIAAQQAMAVTAHNTKTYLLILLGCESRIHGHGNG
ncbi:dehydrodolichyl diphosphate synthase 6-like protein [Tanacetum coccineum]